MYNKEFSDAGIVDGKQLVDRDGNFKSYDDIAIEYHLRPNNQSFIEYVKIISAIPAQWQLHGNFVNNRNRVIESLIEKLQSHGKTTKLFYHHVIFIKVILHYLV